MEKKKTINKNKWFIERKVNGYKLFNKKFRSYLVYIKGNDLISVCIRFSSKSWNDYFYSELSESNKEFKSTIDSNDNNDSNYFTEVFIVSEKEYDVREVFQYLEERRVYYILNNIFGKLKLRIIYIT